MLRHRSETRPLDFKSYRCGGRASRLQAASLFALMTAFVFLMASCASRTEAPASTRSFTDEIGRTVFVRPHPQRIVSLAPSVTETLFALGLDDSVAGVTSYCDYPAAARAKEKVGDTLKPNLEKIVALGADLVIISTSSQLEQSLLRLQELGMPVYVSNPRNLEGVLRSITAIGEVVDATDQARELTAGMRARIEAVEARLAGRPRVSVFFLLGIDPLITVGSGTFIDDLISRAGGRSISADASGEYPQYSMETAVAKQPEVIFIQSGERLPERLAQTPAGRTGGIYRLDDDLVSRPGPRIVAGLEQMAAKIHPEVSGHPGSTGVSPAR